MEVETPEREAADPVAGLPDPHASPTRGRRLVPWGALLAIGCYSLLALAAYFPVWPGDPARMAQCPCADSGLNTWFLAFTAHAVAHGENPFVTTALNYPVGVNLTYNTQMPLLGLVVAPVTLLAGPVASLNLLLWLAIPASASSMFLVLRRWTSWWPAAFAGGLLYGFSPYMVGQSTAHLHLTFVPLPPLIVLAVVELLLLRTDHPTRWGVTLGLLVVAQFLIAPEVLVTTGLVVAVGLVGLALLRPRDARAALRAARTGIVWAVALTVGLLAVPVAEFVAGPVHALGTTGPGTFLIRTDLLGTVVPTSLQRLTPAGLAGVGDRLTAFGDASENGAYLGIPLLVLVAIVTVAGRRDRRIRLAAAMAVVSLVFSMGTPLAVDGRDTGVPLPDELLRNVPLVNQLVPSRISLCTTLFVAILLALGLDRLRRTGWMAVGRTRGARPSHLGRWPARLVLGAVAVLAVASLVPSWPDPTVPVGVPSYFSSGAADRIAPGTVALTYPYPGALHAQPMVWQAVSRLRFSLIGGYALIPGAGHVPALFPSVLPPVAVQRFLIEQDGGEPFLEVPPVADDASLVLEVRQFVVRYRVGVVLVATATPGSDRVVGLFERALGVPAVHGGGIAAFYDVGRAPGLARVRSGAALVGSTVSVDSR